MGTTDPCITADTWVQTSDGPRQVADLAGAPFRARVDGRDHASGGEGFFRAATRSVVRVVTREGHALRLSADHPLRRVARFADGEPLGEWCAADTLRAGERVMLNDHRGGADWGRDGDVAGGHLDGRFLLSWLERETPTANGAGCGAGYGMAPAPTARRTIGSGAGHDGAPQVASSGETGTPRTVDAFALEEILGVHERLSSEHHRGFLRALFEPGCEITVEGRGQVRIELGSRHGQLLASAQRMLLRLGIVAGRRAGADGTARLSLLGENAARFDALVGFARLRDRKSFRKVSARAPAPARERFTALVAAVEPAGLEAVYEVRVPGITAFDANGLHARDNGAPPHHPIVP